MSQPQRRGFTFAFSLSLLFLAATIAAGAQYYPPPPPPPPPNYPAPNYPPPNYPPPESQPPGRYPRQYPRNQPNYIGAQPYLSPYAMFSLGHYSGLGVGNGTPANQSGGMTALGGTFGGYVTFPNPGPLGIGADVRLIIENSANSTRFGNKIAGGLIGLRIDGSGAILPVVPYFQFEVGGVGTNAGTSTTRTASFAYQAQFGADVPLVAQQLSARIEYGTGQLTGSSTNHTLQTFSAGLVLHIR